MVKKELKVSLYLLYAVVIIFLSLVLVYFGPYLSNTITGHSTSQLGNFSASITTYIACDWSNPSLNVGFGSNLNPGTQFLNASNNSIASNFNNTWYNVTNDPISNVAVNITVAGSDLDSGVNAIGVGNITWSSNQTSANGTNMIPTNGYALMYTQDTTHNVATALNFGNTAWFRWWLTIPSAQIAGSYAGNYTMQCIQDI